MCGFYITNKYLSEQKFKSKLETIQFRGPDYTGILKKDNILFGHLRLSVIDLNKRANQPMQYENLTIVFNGEIYNYNQIKDELLVLGYNFDTTSDTEVLLKAYKEWGEAMIQKLNGMFAFVIYNSDTQELFCSRDRLGVKPFYYYWNNGTFEMCSQLRPMSENKGINREAISIYLDCTYIPSPHSIYKDVYKLPPGHNLKLNLKSKKVAIYQYWDLEKIHETKLNFNDAKDYLHHLLKDAIQIRLKSDVPLGSFLSGGIDSALISSIASKLSDNQLNTYTIGFEDSKYDESKIARQYANIIQSNQTEIICKAEDFLKILPIHFRVYDEPFADSSAIPSLLLNKVTKNYVTVSLSGDGGDESFLGYNHFDKVNYYAPLIKIPYIVRLLLSKLGLASLYGKRSDSVKRLLKTRNVQHFIENIFIGTNSLLLKRDRAWLSLYSKYWEQSNNWLQRCADLNIKLWLENDSNVKVDRASMAFALEVRSPFLDYRIIEFARSLPLGYRINGREKKYILKEILKEYIPEEIFKQPKKGFSCPIDKWIRNELRDEFEKNLTDSFLLKVPNLDVQKFKRMFNEHLHGKYDYSSYIWRVYVLSKWYQEFNIV
jgi:asparagine synthase (glutamine-hydrolysing)